MAGAMKIVNLINPELCQDCPFARIAMVTDMNNDENRMIHCLRLDCDNWDSTSSEPVHSFKEDSEDYGEVGG